ncbi:hypothetical protein ACYKKI_03780 [Streptococcus suis]|uniref:hypothetical protein n=1 Tax=Streptococcus TaxID=1301 RepID=UPI0003F70021|nr:MULTISPECIES: hypothetical protein [Streptococcus]MBY0752424.1 hypothetical protein [Streptococcus sp. 2018037]MDW8739666.1 hypothetical protein [Streptococcus suis]NRG73892.1 hypothetical protein [Streptococcus suis]HEL1984408.1 hypothetical protein [Streptococcus suis]HEL2104737.1 hypothetical protein [Streptococcus suis]
MKKYIKENQVYTVQEGSELEVQLIADGFEELVEDTKSDLSKLKIKELVEIAQAHGLEVPNNAKKPEVLELLESNGVTIDE